jgi:hypothetical protein
VALVTLATAKTHLRLDGTADDADVTLKLDAAEATILDYITEPDPAWTAATVPPVIAAAILLQLGELYHFRGDDPAHAMDRAAGDLAPGVAALLRRYRDPAMA